MRRLIYPAILTLMIAGPVAAQQSPAEFAAINERISALDDEKLVEEAAKLAERTLPLAEKRLGGGHHETARLLNLFARMREQQGRKGEAEALFTRALAAAEAADGPSAPFTGTVLRNFGYLHFYAEDHAKAVPLLERGLAIKIAERGADDDSHRLTHRNLAWAQFKAGLFEKSEANYKRALTLAEWTLTPDNDEYAVHFADLGYLYLKTRRLDAAEAPLRRAFDLRTANANPAVRYTATMLGDLYEAKGEPRRALDFYIQAAEGRAAVSGADSEIYAVALNRVAELREAVGDLTGAERDFRAALKIIDALSGADPGSRPALLNNLGTLHAGQGRDTEAVQEFEQALAGLGFFAPPGEKALVLRNLATALGRAGRAEEAETKFTAAITMMEGAGLAETADFAVALSNLAAFHAGLGRLEEAEPLYKRAIAVEEKARGPDHPAIASSLSNFASLLADLGRTAEAEALLKRAIAIRAAKLGDGHALTATSRNNLAALYGDLGRLDEAEALFRQSLAAMESAFGPGHKDVAQALTNLAAIMEDRGKFDDADALLDRAQAIQEKALGPEDAALAVRLNNRAVLRVRQGRTAEAVPLLARALAIHEKALGPAHPTTTEAAANLGRVHLARKDYAKAIPLLERAAGDYRVQRDRGIAAESAGKTGRAGNGFELGKGTFGALIEAYAYESGLGPARMDQAFQAAQRASGTIAASALAQMAVRQSADDPTLAALVRERQDLIGEFQSNDRALVSRAAKLVGERGDGAALADRQRKIDERLVAIDAGIAQAFPDFAALSNPAPLAIAEAQAALKAGEVALFYFETWQLDPIPDETYLWAIPKSGPARWVRLDKRPGQIAKRVRALRELLGVGGPARGATAVVEEGEAQVFDLQYAYELHQTLLAPVADLIAGKSLVIVNSESLASLPFQLLVSEKPAPGMGYGAARWLARDHATTVLPSISALTLLRRDARPSLAPDPYLGIGNPLLVGDDGADRRAFAVKGCGGAVAQAPAGAAVKVAGLMRGGAGDLEDVRRLAPLPETMEELCAVAASLGADARAVLGGADATEAAMKKMSAAGALARARILHFATHGLVAGEISGLAEPAIVLSPPGTASGEDDGLLKASEVAALKLDADWVILSACNTAAGEGESAEALSGLARAFFYAGARSLMVSHWPVNSEAAVELTTGAIAEMARDPSLGRAEALRHAMLTALKAGGRKAHPAYWAPFVVAGEGG